MSEPSSRVSFGEAARALLALEGPTAVSAGAGAGKTTALVELVVRLLSGDVPWGTVAAREVAAITFTERAGAELVDRLGRALTERRDEVAARGDAARARRLEEAARDLPSMAAGTIHGFAARILREHPLDAGVDPEFEVLEEEGASELRAGAALAAVAAALDGGDGDARRLVAGLGGAAPAAAAVEALCRERATRGLTGPPEWARGDAAAVEAACRETEEAARALLSLAGTASTPTGRDALAALAREWEGLAPPAEGGSRDARALAGLPRALRGWRHGKGDPPELRAARERLVEAAEALPPLAAEVAAEPLARALVAMVGEAERRYREAKGRERGLDFDDLLLRVRDLLATAPAVRADVRSRYRALLVDEYQDVNGLQAEIFGLLSGEDAATGPPALLVAVGDAKQSIYRFRGADVAVFAALMERLGPGGEGRLLHLSDNHRSTPGVIALVNDVLDRGGPAIGVPFGPEDRLRASRPGGTTPAAVLLDVAGDGARDRREAEAEALALHLARILSGEAGVLLPDGRPPRPGEVAILFRRLTQVAVFERALRKAGIPIRLARGGGFHQAPEVRDLGELLATVADPADAIAWAALLRSPLCGLSDGSLLLAVRTGWDRLWRDGPEEEAARARLLDVLPAEEAERLRRFLATWRVLREARDRLDVRQLLERAASGLDLEAALLASPDGERRAANLRKALELARRAASRGLTAALLAARMRRLAALPPREPEADPASGDAVVLLSVHQAKGLEWPVVAVPELSARVRGDGRRVLLDGAGRVCVAHLEPAGDGATETASMRRAREAGSRAEAAESRRLLYVALTRARDHLVLSGTGGRSERGTWAEAIGAVPAELLERVRPVPGTSGPGGGAPIESGPGVATATALSVPEMRPPVAARPVRIAVTELAEFRRCPRRHWWARALRLPEPREEERGGDDPDRATVRGTLAHALLAEVDLIAPPLARRALLAAIASRRGRDPRSPGVRPILEDVERFLASPDGERLSAAARARRLRREVPFLLRLDGSPATYLDGAIDALVLGTGGDVEVLDFKYAHLHPGSVDRYRLQLLAYALAAGRAFPGERVRATLQFLRGHARSVDVTPAPEETARFAREAPAQAFGAACGEGRDLTPTTLGRDESLCRSEGCGFLRRCFPAAPP